MVGCEQQSLVGYDDEYRHLVPEKKIVLIEQLNLVPIQIEQT